MKIPVYSRRQTPHVGAIAPRESPEEAARVGRQVSQAGKALSEIGLLFEGLRAYQQTNKARLETYKGFAEIDTQAANDPDIDNPDVQKTYIDQFSTLREKVLGGIRNIGARNKYADQYDLDAAKRKVQIGGYGRKTLIEKSKATIEEKLNLMAGDFAIGDKETRGKLLGSMSREIGIMETKGLFKPGEARKLEQKYKKDWQKNALYFLIENDPEEAKRQLNSGMFPYIGVDTRKTALTWIKTRKTEIKQQIEDTRERNYQDLKTKAITGGVKDKVNILLEARELLEQKEPGITADQYEDIEDYVTKDKAIAPEINMATYNKIRTMQETGKDLEGNPMTERDINAFILRQVGRTLEETEAKQLMDKSYAVMGAGDKTRIKIAEDGIKAWGQREILGDVAAVAVPEASKGVLNGIIYNFHKRVEEEKAGGSRIDEIAREEVLNYYRRTYPKMALTESMPTDILMGDGSMKSIWPLSAKQPKPDVEYPQDSGGGIKDEYGFIEGEIRRDREGNRRKYIGDNKWKLIVE